MKVPKGANKSAPYRLTPSMQPTLKALTARGLRPTSYHPGPASYYPGCSHSAPIANRGPHHSYPNITSLHPGNSPSKPLTARGPSLIPPWPLALGPHRQQGGPTPHTQTSPLCAPAAHPQSPFPTSGLRPATHQLFPPRDSPSKPLTAPFLIDPIPHWPCACRQVCRCATVHQRDCRKMILRRVSGHGCMQAFTLGTA